MAVQVVYLAEMLDRGQHWPWAVLSDVVRPLDQYFANLARMINYFCDGFNIFLATESVRTDPNDP